MPCGLTSTELELQITGSGCRAIGDGSFSLSAGTPDFAVIHYPNSGDIVLANSINSAYLPTSLIGDEAAYLRAGYGNLGNAYGCDCLSAQLGLDENVLVTFTPAVAPNILFLSGAITTVRGGRHTVWENLDPDNVQAESVPFQITEC